MKTTNHSLSRSRKALVIFLCLFTLSLTVIPQNQPQQKRRENIENLKIAFLSRKMGLTPAESQKFWPLYNAYESNLKKLENNVGGLKNIDEQKLATMSDSEIEASLKAFIENGEKILDLRKTFHEDLKKVLSVRKVALFYMAERDFKKELVKMAIAQRRQKKG